MAPIKPWCISPTSQREQSQPTALHAVSFFHCFCVLKVFLIMAAIKSDASLVHFLANAKEKSSVIKILLTWQFSTSAAWMEIVECDLSPAVLPQRLSKIKSELCASCSVPFEDWLMMDPDETGWFKLLEAGVTLCLKAGTHNWLILLYLFCNIM